MAPLVTWISDGARGFWRLFQELFAPKGAVGILDFYHAAQHLWQAAIAYQDGNPAHAPLRCGLIEWVTNYIMVLASASSDIAYSRLITKLTYAIAQAGTVKGFALLTTKTTA